jgi:hypothetical protein
MTNAAKRLAGSNATRQKSTTRGGRAEDFASVERQTCLKSRQTTLKVHASVNHSTTTITRSSSKL